MYRIEQAIKKSKGKDGQAQDEQTARHLQRLLNEAHSLVPDSASPSDQASSVQPLESSPRSQFSVSSRGHSALQHSAGGTLPAPSGNEDSLALEDAENPLQLLARASDFPMPARLMPTSSTRALPGQRPLGSELVRSKDLQAFFGPLNSHLDVGPEIDPIDMGFVDLEDAEVLFN